MNYLDFDGFIIGLAVGFIAYEVGSWVAPYVRRWRRKRAFIQCSVCHVESLSPTPPRCRRPDCPHRWPSPFHEGIE
jgi:hypothetical protein